MIYTGLNYTDATTAGIIMALSPIMTMVLARFVLGEPLGMWKALGALLALLGMVVIVAHGDLAALLRLQFNPGELWIVGSALCWGLYTVLLRRSKFEHRAACRWSCCCSAPARSPRCPSISGSWCATSARRSTRTAFWRSPMSPVRAAR